MLLFVRTVLICSWQVTFSWILLWGTWTWSGCLWNVAFVTQPRSFPFISLSISCRQCNREIVAATGRTRYFATLRRKVTGFRPIDRDSMWYGVDDKPSQRIPSALLFNVPDRCEFFGGWLINPKDMGSSSDFRLLWCRESTVHWKMRAARILLREEKRVLSVVYLVNCNLLLNCCSYQHSFLKIHRPKRSVYSCIWNGVCSLLTLMNVGDRFVGAHFVNRWWS